MCDREKCGTCNSHPSKIKLDFLDIFVGIFSVEEERELDREAQKEEGV
jgi:hypothetical protein